MTTTDRPGTVDTVSLGRKLLAAREAKGWTTDEVLIQMHQRLPRALFMSRTKINALELGRTAKPDPFDVAALAYIYDIGVGELDEGIAEALVECARVIPMTGNQNTSAGVEGDAHQSRCSATRQAVAA